MKEIDKDALTIDATVEVAMKLFAFAFLRKTAAMDLRLPPEFARLPIVAQNGLNLFLVVGGGEKDLIADHRWGAVTSPGTRLFHKTFSDSLHFRGGFCLPLAMPLRFGPRHQGQSVEQR